MKHAAEIVTSRVVQDLLSLVGQTNIMKLYNSYAINSLLMSMSRPSAFRDLFRGLYTGSFMFVKSHAFFLPGFELGEFFSFSFD